MFNPRFSNFLYGKVTFREAHHHEKLCRSYANVIKKTSQSSFDGTVTSPTPLEKKPSSNGNFSNSSVDTDRLFTIIKNEFMENEREFLEMKKRIQNVPKNWNPRSYTMRRLEDRPFIPRQLRGNKSISGKEYNEDLTNQMETFMHTFDIDLGPHHRHLLPRALTDSYYGGMSKVPNNEKLRFLGRSILRMYTAEALLVQRTKWVNLSNFQRTIGLYTNKSRLFQLGKEMGVEPLIRTVNKRRRDVLAWREIVAHAVTAIVGAIYEAKGPLEAKDFILENIISGVTPVQLLHQLLQDSDVWFALQDFCQTQEDGTPKCVIEKIALKQSEWTTGKIPFQGSSAVSALISDMDNSGKSDVSTDTTSVLVSRKTDDGEDNSENSSDSSIIIDNNEDNMKDELNPDVVGIKSKVSLSPKGLKFEQQPNENKKEMNIYRCSIYQRSVTKIIGYAEGKTEKDAQQLAAGNALLTLLATICL